MSKATIALSQLHALTKRQAVAEDAARLLDLCRRMEAEWLDFQKAAAIHDAAEGAYAALRAKLGRMPGEDTPEAQKVNRTEDAQNAVLDRRDAVIAQIQTAPAISPEALAIKVEVLKLLLAADSATLASVRHDYPADNLAYAIVRDVEALTAARGAL